MREGQEYTPIPVAARRLRGNGLFLGPADVPKCKIEPMLTRVYINNYRCLVDFDFRPARRQLIMGANGSGKSSFMDALLFLRRIVILKQRLERHNNVLGERTLWLNLRHQTFEIEALLDDTSYVYRLEIEPHGDPERPRVRSESVKFNGELIFDFRAGEVHLFDDQFQHKVAYPFEPDRSALAGAETRDNRKLVRFKEWVHQLLVFRLNPFSMKALAKGEDQYPFFDLSNFAAWYRHLVQSAPRETRKLLENLRAALDDFDSLEFGEAIENMRLLSCVFVQKGGPDVKLSFNQLSDGQRCLVGLYTILQFVISKGHTAIIDEPDNFISLREIQPWLHALSDALDDRRGQVLLISHHPEILDQWAPSYGIRFTREDDGAVVIKEFRGEAYSSLAPSEIVARGWENE